MGVPILFSVAVESVMIESKPSVTAYRVALRRAAHQVLDARPLVFDDPIALRIIGQQHAAALRDSPETMERGPYSRYLRAFLVARSRIAEDALASAVALGVRQYVVLGAGLDTFAYRNPYADLRVFEVDFPATQQWKRERLAAGDIAVPDSVTFAPIDFDREQLADILANAGLNPDRPAFFSWLGVTPYLEPPTVLATLRTIAQFARGGGGVAFDYAVPPESLSLMQRAAVAMLAARVAEHGEPFRGYFDPTDLATALSSMGFTTIEDLGQREINARFFAGRRDSLQVGAAGRIMTAVTVG
jgi:methyltransferase (TIGR00027 family)